MNKVTIDDSKISMIWKGTDSEISIDPTFYQDNGTPVDGETGEDMEYVRTEIELPKLIAVSVVEYNVVSSMFVFTDKKEAELKFRKLAKELLDSQMSEKNIKSCLKNGYAEYASICVCISHPE